MLGRALFLSLDCSTLPWDWTSGLPDHWWIKYRWYEWVYFFLPSVLWDTRRETQIVKYFADHSILTPTTTHSIFCDVNDLNSFMPVESQTDLIWSDPKNSNVHFNGRTSTNRLFKIFIFSGQSLSGDDIIHTLYSFQRPSNPIFILWVYYDRWWLSYPFNVGVREHHMTQAPELRDTQEFKTLPN